MRLLVAQHMLRDIQGVLAQLEVRGEPQKPPKLPQNYPRFTLKHI